ncbi:MAG: Uma2 family endonuclease [Hamadaea sp.]|nr:Uma2 family endonuclease [Hamadaea sp.]
MRKGAVPWTEEDFIDLGESNERIELFDGSLVVSPAPTPRHQLISTALMMDLLPAAKAVGLRAFEAVNVRLRPDVIPIPDIAITRQIDLTELIIDVADVLLVGEILSPSNPAADRVTKMHYYATAGIEWYLIVDPDGPMMDLYRLKGDVYQPHAAASPGAPLHLTEPIEVVIDPARLLD